VINSLTKLECLICQIGLSDFDSSNSVASFIKFQNHLFHPPLGDTKGLSPLRVSIERTDRMLVFMGPVSLVAYRQQMLGFAPTASMIGSGGKLGTDPWIDQSACCGLCRESLFSGAVVWLNSIDNYTKGCYMWTT
jgi:hypothetical protein